MIAHGYQKGGASLQSNENVLNLDLVMVAQPCEYTTTIELYTLGLIL